jgi:hypothetical protein
MSKRDYERVTSQSGPFGEVPINMAPWSNSLSDGQKSMIYNPPSTSTTTSQVGNLGLPKKFRFDGDSPFDKELVKFGKDNRIEIQGNPDSLFLKTNGTLTHVFPVKSGNTNPNTFKRGTILFARTDRNLTSISARRIFSLPQVNFLMKTLADPRTNKHLVTSQKKMDMIVIKNEVDKLQLEYNEDGLNKNRTPIFITKSTVIKSKNEKKIVQKKDYEKMDESDGEKESDVESESEDDENDFHLSQKPKNLNFTDEPYNIFSYKQNQDLTLIAEKLNFIGISSGGDNHPHFDTTNNDIKFINQLMISSNIRGRSPVFNCFTPSSKGLAAGSKLFLILKWKRELIPSTSNDIYEFNSFVYPVFEPYVADLVEEPPVSELRHEIDDNIYYGVNYYIGSVQEYAKPVDDAKLTKLSLYDQKVYEQLPTANIIVDLNQYIVN